MHKLYDYWRKYRYFFYVNIWHALSFFRKHRHATIEHKIFRVYVSVCACVIRCVLSSLSFNDFGLKDYLGISRSKNAVYIWKYHECYAFFYYWKFWNNLLLKQKNNIESIYFDGYRLKFYLYSFEFYSHMTSL